VPVENTILCAPFNGCPTSTPVGPENSMETRDESSGRFFFPSQHAVSEMVINLVITPSYGHIDTPFGVETDGEFIVIVLFSHLIYIRTIRG
jgi:hypothetical protein